MTPQLWRARLNTLLAEHAHAVKTVQEETAYLEEARGMTLTTVQVQQMFQAVAKTVEEAAHQQVSQVVTRCLRTVGWDYDFGIVFEAKRGKTEARLVFYRDGHEVDPVNAAGGGPLDVAAFALRLASLLLGTPKRRRLLLLDEPFKNVNGREYQERTGQLIETLSQELGVQMVVVTDDDWLKIGTVVEV